MNVTCPQCATVFRVDPAKVPERGVRARCSVCNGLIAVRRPDVAAPAVPPIVPVAPPTPPAMAAPARPAAEIRVDPPLAPPIMSPVVPIAALPDEGPFGGEMFATPPAPPAPPPVAAVSRHGNPFLQQDPATRARRLARALVSDLVVYHPEKRQRGLNEGNLKELFAEEIRKSWEEYTEQVGDEIAGSTPYFTEALNEILAEGRTLFG